VAIGFSQCSFQESIDEAVPFHSKFAAGLPSPNWELGMIAPFFGSFFLDKRWFRNGGGHGPPQRLIPRSGKEGAHATVLS
jgi:hypothetical protein